MAFNPQQTKRIQIGVSLTVLALVAVLAVMVVSGAFSPSASAPHDDDRSVSTQTDGKPLDQSGTDEHDMTHVDATYRAAEQQLLAAYENDRANPEALLNVANGYFDWGVAAMGVARAGEDEQHVIDIFHKAIARYDEYLEAYPGSKSAEVDRAICIFYAGDSAKAIKTLEDFVARDDSFAPAWANLGMFYESQNRAGDARDAYQKAVEKDPDGSYNVKPYAEERLANLK